MKPLLPAAALMLAISGSAFAAPPEDDTTQGLLDRVVSDRADGDQARSGRGGGSSRGGSRPSASPSKGSRGAPAASRPAPSSSRGAPPAKSGGGGGRPEHAGPPADRGPSAEHGRPDHAGPPADRGPSAEHGRPDHAGPPADRGPSAEHGRPDHAGPPDHAGEPRHGGPSAGPAHVRPAAPVQPRHVAPPHHVAPPRHEPARHVPGPVTRHDPPPRVDVHVRHSWWHRHVAPPPPPPRPVHYHVHHVRPYHGVFVYGPRPVYHTTYVQKDAPVVQEHLPERKIDREDTLAVGVFGGSYVGGYDSAAGYADPGLGVNVRYRPDETVGLEVALSHFGMESEDSTRATTVGQANVELFAYPWTRVSPYATAGLTLAPRSFQDAYYDEDIDRVQLNSSESMMFGPNVGLGIEFALGKSVALDLEGRYTAFLGTDDQDPTVPGSFQTRAGVVVHFK